MPRDCRTMLDRDMDVSEMAFERITRVDRVGSRSVEHQIDRPGCLMHAVRDRKPGLSDLGRGIRISRLERLPCLADRVMHVGARGAPDRLGPCDTCLHKWPIAK